MVKLRKKKNNKKNMCIMKDSEVAVLKSIMKNPCIDTQEKRYKTKQRHREHSKKHHQVYKEILGQGKSSEVAKQIAREAACKHVKSLFKA